MKLILKITLYVTHNFLHVYNFKDINLDIITILKNLDINKINNKDINLQLDINTLLPQNVAITNFTSWNF